MTKPSCSRAWEPSAIEDGRLDTPSEESFRRHVDSCGVCQEEVRALRLLGDLASFTEPDCVSQLEHRRMRQSLLRAAHSPAPRLPKRSARRAALVGAACAATALAATLEFRQPSSGSKKHRTSTALAPSYDARSVSGAVWHQEQPGPSTRIALSSGVLDIHVRPLASNQHFIVDLPDGELEVRGTRFVVQVSKEHTESVRVTEGTVALRLHGAATRTIAAGEAWVGGEPLPPAPTSDPFATTPLGPVAAQPSHALRAESRPRGAAETGHRTASGPYEGIADSAGAQTPRPEGDAPMEVSKNAAEEFVAAMSALSSGAYVEADEYFAEFAARFRGDARVEDAVYLRTVIALRRGDRDAAAVRARDYLNRFPHGLRRNELEKLASEPRPRR